MDAVFLGVVAGMAVLSGLLILGCRQLEGR